MAFSQELCRQERAGSDQPDAIDRPESLPNGGLLDQGSRQAERGADAKTDGGHDVEVSAAAWTQVIRPCGRP